MKSQNTNSTGPTLDRRCLLGGASVATAATALSAPGHARFQNGGGRDVYVQIFLRGGLDGLSALVPHGDANYYTARPTLAIAAPGQVDGAIDLDGFFGLNPNLAPLMVPYANGDLAFVHAVGLTDTTRSHFDAYNRLEYGTPDAAMATKGWLTRFLEQVDAPESGLLRGVSADRLLPLSMSRADRCQAVPDFEHFFLPGPAATVDDRINKLRSMYQRAPAPLGVSATQTFDSLEVVDAIDFANYVPSNAAQYPDTLLGIRMAHIACLIKANVGIELAHVDFESFDHHMGQEPLDGPLAEKLTELSQALEAFYLDLTDLRDQVTVACLSEFGRTVAENDSRGTDHGRGGVMMLMGGGINGGQVVAHWPGLAPANLDDGDLAVTIDYRDVLGEILTERLGATDLSTIFPGHTFTTQGLTV